MSEYNEKRNVDDLLFVDMKDEIGRLVSFPDDNVSYVLKAEGSSYAMIFTDDKNDLFERYKCKSFDDGIRQANNHWELINGEH